MPPEGTGGWGRERNHSMPTAKPTSRPNQSMAAPCSTPTLRPRGRSLTSEVVGVADEFVQAVAPQDGPEQAHRARGGVGGREGHLAGTDERVRTFGNRAVGAAERVEAHRRAAVAAQEAHDALLAVLVDLDPQQLWAELVGRPRVARVR